MLSAIIRESILLASMFTSFCKILFFIGALTIVAGCSNDPGGVPEPVDLAQAALEWNSGSKQWSDGELKTLEVGKNLYRGRCAGCHQQTGVGSTTIGAPALKGSAVARGSADILIRTVLFGRGSMPAFRMSLDDAGLARILSYVRNAWGNDMQDIVQLSRIAEIRAGS